MSVREFWEEFYHIKNSLGTVAECVQTEIAKLGEEWTDGSDDEIWGQIYWSWYFGCEMIIRVPDGTLSDMEKVVRRTIGRNGAEDNFTMVRECMRDTFSYLIKNEEKIRGEIIMSAENENMDFAGKPVGVMPSLFDINGDFQRTNTGIKC